MIMKALSAIQVAMRGIDTNTGQQILSGHQGVDIAGNFRCARKRGLACSKVEGSDQVVLGSRSSACSHSLPILSLPHWEPEHWSFTGLHFTNRSGYFPLKTKLKASHSFSVHSWALAMWADFWTLYPITFPFLHSPGKGPLQSSQPSQMPRPPAKLNMEPGWHTHWTTAPKRENRELHLGKHMHNKIRILGWFAICKRFWAHISRKRKKKKGFYSFDPFKLSCLLISLWEGNV